MKDDIAQLFLQYGMKPPKPWVKKPPLYKPKWDCFAFREIDPDEYVCGCLDRLYCKYEKCKFFKTRGEYYAKRYGEKEA